MKKAILISIGIILLIASLLIAGYPFISSYLNSQNAAAEILAYSSSTEDMSNDKINLLLEQAHKYNESLIGSVAVSGDPFAKTETDENYNNMLRIDGSEIMASLEIPSIAVNLPIYHGTSNEILQKGLGHLSGSSLPVGGNGTHSVITGHTGDYSNKLFSDLANVKTGDVFFIKILNQTLAYRVDNIATVLPEETELLTIDENEDYVTLVTCTPFGINDHRLLVRGTRISYEEAKNLAQSQQVTDDSSLWKSEYIKAIFIGVVVMLAILLVFFFIKLLNNHRERNNEK